MAIVSLKDVSVSRVNGKGFGVKVLEQSESKGQTYKTYYTVWFSSPHGLTEGDVISVSGFLGAKASEWEDKEGNARHSVELSINSPKLDGFPAKGEPEAEPASDPWPASSEVPF